MRARSVYDKRAFVFDWDDTLVSSQAKVHIKVDGKRSYSLTPAQFNFYTQEVGEEIDVSDFEDPRLIMSSKKGKMWKMLSNVYFGAKMDMTDSDIFILTARNEKAQIPIHNYLKRAKIDVPLDNIMCVSRSDGRMVDIKKEKELILRAINAEYDQLSFYDDSLDNIQSANTIPGINTRLVEKIKR